MVSCCVHIHHLSACRSYQTNNALTSYPISSAPTAFTSAAAASMKIMRRSSIFPFNFEVSRWYDGSNCGFDSTVAAIRCYGRAIVITRCWAARRGSRIGRHGCFVWCVELMRWKEGQFLGTMQAGVGSISIKNLLIK